MVNFYLEISKRNARWSVCGPYSIIKPKDSDRWEVYFFRDFCDSFGKLESAEQYIRYNWRVIEDGGPVDRDTRPPLPEEYCRDFLAPTGKLAAKNNPGGAMNRKYRQKVRRRPPKTHRDPPGTPEDAKKQ